MPKTRPISEPMEIHADIVIAGGGLTGMTTAIALAQAGHDVALVDPEASPAQDGRSYAMALTSVRLMRNLGLWDGLAANAQPILDIKVSDGRAGEGPSPFFMHFDHAEIEEGPMGHMLEDRDLRPALLEAMEASGIRFITQDAVAAHKVQPVGVEVRLKSGARIDSKLLVACDGKNSPSAARAGIRRVGWPYDQTALVCVIAHERPHNGIAHQFFMPQGPLAILPLKGNRSGLVWSETASRAATFMQLDVADFLTLLRPRIGSFLGAFSLDGPRFTYPLSLSLATRMVAPRLALVGDAAHGVHPIAGQGLNAGMRDIAALVEVLSRAMSRGEDLGSENVLARYEGWRRLDNLALGIATDSFNRLFSNDNSILRLGRDLGMGLLSALPDLRRNTMREAAGLNSDLPDLMQK